MVVVCFESSQTFLLLLFWCQMPTYCTKGVKQDLLLSLVKLGRAGVWSCGCLVDA